MATPKNKSEKKNKGGRPTLYTEELANLICERVATSTLGLARLCAMYDDLPDKTTVNLWRYRYAEFSTQYAQAKLKQADLLAEEMLDIADDGTNDWIESFGQDGEMMGYKLNGEHVQRSRLRIDTRKFLASKLLPKQYGQHAEEDKNNSKAVIEMLIDKLSE
jgi:hypothetical protein